MLELQSLMPFLHICVLKSHLILNPAKFAKLRTHNIK